MNQFVLKVRALLNRQGGSSAKYLANTSWVFAERVLLLGTSFVVGVYVARYLGAAQFGVLAYALSFGQLFSALAVMGLERILVRELINRPDARGEILSTTLLLRLAGAIVAVGMAVIASTSLGNSSAEILAIAIITAGNILQSFAVIDSFFQSQVEAKHTAVARFWASILATAMKFILVLMKAPLLHFVIVYGVETSLFGVGLLVQYLRTQKRFWRWAPQWKLAASLMRDAWPLILGGFMINLYSRIDRIMINEMLTPVETGEYSAGLKLFETLSFLPVVICTSLFPAILNARKNSATKYQQRMKQLYGLMTGSAWVVAIGLAVTASWLVPLLYGEEYLAGASVLQIVAFTLVPISIGLAVSQYLIAENMVKVDMARKIIGMLSNVGLNFYLIPIMGIIGASWATLVSHVLTDILVIAFTPARNQFGPILRALVGIGAFEAVRQKLKHKQ
jgi:O-antigen/teichoic acid export membrane protein